MAQVLAELALVRRQIAQWAGYDSYTDYAWDYSYYRDYTAEQAAGYLADIRRELVPLYENMNAMDVWTAADVPCSEQEVLRYVKKTAKAMGGIVQEACTVMELAELYDISADPNKSGLSFELFLAWYYEPYLFISGTGTAYDQLSFAHEFGHFAMDYAAGGSWAGTDVTEIFSQGMEYLSLACAEAEGDFVRMKLADSLCTYVEQAAYAEFELRLYELPEEELTGENLLALYEEVGEAYGFRSLNWDPRDMVTIPHFYEQPLYVISYVVSNDAAMQLYEMELSAPGTGAACFQTHLTTEALGLMEFLREAELKSPFDRIDEVKGIMEGYFGK
jgi:oligoendopeptidase F